VRVREGDIVQNVLDEHFGLLLELGTIMVIIPRLQYPLPNLSASPGNE
jgi:hypothetical protein